MVSIVRGLLVAFALFASGGIAMAADLENTLYLDVPAGRVVIAMRPDLAPNHVAQIKALARRGFYDGVPFHRVIDGFMAVCCGLLGLLDHEFGVEPGEALRRMTEVYSAPELA